MPYALLWLLLRLVNSLAAALSSTLRPLTPLEKAIPLWPPAPSLSLWLERLLLSPLLRWDAIWFVRILTQGYQSGDGTTAFHPLLPLLAVPLSVLGIHPVLSLLLVNALAALGLFYAFPRLARLDLSAEDAHTALLLLAFSPLAFTLFIPYTEALYLLFAVLCLLYARQRRWGLAGLCGALATLTRQQGLLLLLPLLWEAWEANQHRLRSLLRSWKSWAGMALIPLALLAWLLYRGLALDDVPLDIRHPLDLIYNILLSPSTSQVVPSFRFLPPWQTFALALEKLRTAPDLDLWTNFIFALLILAGILLAWPRMCTSYRIFSLAIVLVALSDYTGPVHPYMGLPRHLWLAFPAFIGLAPLVRRPWQRLALVGFGLSSGLFLLLQYVLESWVL